MRQFLFEDKDYEINPRYKVPKKEYALVAGLAALYYFSKYHSGKSFGGYGTGVRRYAIDWRQNCTVKMHYSYSMDAHKEQINRYLQREGTGKDGKGAKLYGCDEKEYREHMVSKNFRIFLSPGSDKVTLSALATTFIKQLELQTGYTLYWLAAEHYNTEHPHVHLLINGKDKNGQDVYISPDLVKTHMRDIARDICTSLVGSRTDEQIREEKRNQLKAARYIKLDREIENLMFTNNTVDTKSIFTKKELLLTRLEHLHTMGVCKKDGKKYIFEKDWIDTLKNVGRYNVYLDARNELHYTSKYDFTLFHAEEKNVSGIVTKVYRMQEDSDANAVVVESIDGKAYFIPLYQKAPVKQGETVTVEVVRNQKGRLTPRFEKVNEEVLQKECVAKGYTKGFAAALMKKNLHERTKESYTNTTERSNR